MAVMRFMANKCKMQQKYRKFVNVDEAIHWGKKYYSYWLPRYQRDGELRDNFETEHPESCLLDEFSQEEIEVLKKDALEYKWFSFYCGGNHGLAINERLRYGCTKYEYPTTSLDTMQEVMDMRLNNACVPENIWGYRFLDYNDLCTSTKKHHIVCGDLIIDNGYMGVGLVKSALKEEFGAGDTLLKIMIPQGAKGLYIDLISARRKEQEMLFARGSKLKVKFVYRLKGKRIMICKMLK